MKKALLLCILFMVFQSLQAQWLKTNGPPGGEFHDIEEAPNGTLYAAPLSGGLYKSSDGIHWQYVSLNLPQVPEISIKDIAVHRDGDVFIIVFLPENQLMRSSDEGNSWQVVDNGIVHPLYSITTDTAGNLYAAGPGNDLAVYFSQDAGNNWTYTELALQESVSEYQPLIILSTSGGLIIGSNEELYRTNDSGVTWDSISPGEGSIKALAISSDSILYLSKGSIIYLSGDFGNTWTFVHFPDISTIFSLAVNSTNTVVAGAAQGMLCISADGGINWEVVQALDYNSFFNVLRYTSQDVLYSGTYGISRSYDDGHTWIYSSDGLAASTIFDLKTNSQGDIFAISSNYPGIKDSLYRSTDGGTTWTALSKWPYYRNNGVYIHSNDDIYITADQLSDTGLLFRSTDNGDSWEELLKGASPFGAYYAAVDPEGSIYVTTYRGVIKSTDDGETWSFIISEPLCHLHVITIRDQSLMFLSSAYYCDTSLYRSTDGGLTFHALQAPVPVNYKTIIFNNKGHMFLASGSLIYRSADEGESWESFTVSDSYISHLVIDSNNVIYASSSNGVSISFDDGESWTLINQGLELTQVYDLALDESGMLYASVFNSGLWKTEVIINAQNIQVGETAMTIYPNPATDQVTIVNNWQHMQKKPLLTIHDLSGRIISKHTLPTPVTQLHITHLKPGIYFLRLQNGKFQKLVKL